MRAHAWLTDVKAVQMGGEHSITIDLNHEIEIGAHGKAGACLWHKHLINWCVGFYNLATCSQENTHSKMYAW